MIKDSILFFIFFLFITFSRADDIPLPLMTVQGKGEVKIPPDRAAISIGVQLRNNTLSSVREEADQKSADIIAYLGNQGINSTDIKTSYVTLQPYYNYQPVDDGDPSPDYYIATKSLTFILRNLSRFDDVMQGLYDLGVNSVNGIEFQINNEEEQKIIAKRRAVNNAQDAANAMAEELGINLGRVYSVNDQTASGGNPVPYYTNGDFATADDSSTGPSVAGGVVIVEASVAVNFYIIDNS